MEDNLLDKYNIETINKDIRQMYDSLLKAKQDLADASSDAYKSNLTQWVVNGRTFNPSGEIKIVDKLPAGWYRMVFNGYTYVPELISIKDENLVHLPDPVYNSVLDDIRRFWDSQEKYKEYGFAHKRGILLYGDQGSGKSCLIRLIADKLITGNKGVIFNVGSPDEIYSFEKVFNTFRDIEPDRPATVVLEDIDNFMRYGGSTTSKLLNILDGSLQFDNVVFLATTNFPSVLYDSIRNRPSRFDRRYRIMPPNEESRKVYIKAKFPNMEDKEVNKVVQGTAGLTLDTLKEVVLSTVVLGYPLDKTIKEMKGMFSLDTASDSTSFETMLENDDKIIKDNSGYNFDIEPVPPLDRIPTKSHIIKRKDHGERN